MPKDEFITVEELAESLKVHPRTILRFIKQKELTAVRIGRQWRFKREDVEEWVQRSTVQSREAKSA